MNAEINVDFIQLVGLGLTTKFSAMEWIPHLQFVVPLYLILVRLFYCKSRFNGLRAMSYINTSLRGIDIEVKANEIFRILGIPEVGACIYETKTWQQMERFIPEEAVKRLCGLESDSNMSNTSAAGLTMESQIIHNIIGHDILPRARHKDEVTYLEAFIIDSTLMGRQLYLGNIIIHHMITCCKKKKQVLPYGRIITKVFEAKGINLSREPDIDKPSLYDTISKVALSRMKIYKMKDETWAAGKGEEGDYGDEEVSDKEDEDIEHMEGGADQQLGLDEDISPPIKIDAPWLGLLEQLTSLQTVVRQIEADMSELQTNMRDKLVHQHEEVMKYLQSFLPHPPSQP